MNKFESLIEINPEKVENLAEYIAYCKYYFKPKIGDEVEYYLYQNNQNKNWYLDRNNKEILLKEFKFLEKEINNCVENGNQKNLCENQLAQKLKNYKANETLKDFPLNWLKSEIFDKEQKYIDFNNDDNIQKIKQISGIYIDCEKLKKHIEKLPKYSFAIWSKIKLKAPYFSKDDDEFYIIQNPILKETNFKVPMVRGSSIKGALLHSAIDILNEEVNIENLKSFFRIFGVGNDTFRAIFKKEGIDKNQLQLFLAFEIGINPDKNLEEAFEKYKQSKAQKGRAIFYPIFFDKLSLEVINPHDRKTKAGTNPIYYEVVPKDTESTLQIIYIPFDAILENDKKIQKEAKQDLKFLTKCIERLSQNGLGAKTKLGWGRFEILEKKVCLNSEIQIPEGWGKC